MQKFPSLPPDPSGAPDPDESQPGGHRDGRALGRSSGPGDWLLCARAVDLQASPSARATAVPGSSPAGVRTRAGAPAARRARGAVRGAAGAAGRGGGGARAAATAGALRGGAGAGWPRGSLSCARHSGRTDAQAAASAPASAPGPLGLQCSCRWPGSAQIPGRALGAARPGLPVSAPADHAPGTQRGTRPGREPAKTRLPDRGHPGRPAGGPHFAPRPRAPVSRGYGALIARRAAERVGGAGWRGGGGAAGGARGLLRRLDRGAGALSGAAHRATVLGNALVMLAFVADSSLRTQNNFFCSTSPSPTSLRG